MPIPMRRRKRPRLASVERRFRKSRRPRRTQWQQHLVYRPQYGISQEQMLSKFQDQGSQGVKTTRRVDSKLQKRRRARQLVDDDQRAEMRGKGKAATASIATGTATAAGAAAGKDTGSTEGGIETAMMNRPHVVTAGVTEAGVALGTMTMADDTDTTGPRGAEVAAGIIDGRQETDVVKDPQTDGGVSVLNAGGVNDRHSNPSYRDHFRRLAGCANVEEVEEACKLHQSA